MNKQLIVYVILLGFGVYVTPLSAQRSDCLETIDSIDKFYKEKQWQKALDYCASYERHQCDYSAHINDIKQKCEKQLNQAKNASKNSTGSSQNKATAKNPFSAAKQYIEFPANGGQQKIQVSATAGWFVFKQPGWLSVSKSGNAISISCSSNNYSSAREDDIVLVDYEYREVRITVMQDGSRDYITVSSKLINDSQGNGGRYTINVTSNKAWSVRNKPQWCTVSTEANRIVVTLERNKTGYTRRGDIEIVSTYASSIKQTIAVQQSSLQHYIYISPQVVNSANGKKGEATVTVDTDYGNYRVTNLPYWCKLLRQNSTSFVLEIDDNSGGQARTAECKVVAGDKVEILTIKQGSRMSYVNVSPQIVNAVTDGGIITINVKSSGSWRVVNLPDWCQVTDQTSTSFTLTIARNPGASRTATFSVSSSGMRENVMVIQE